MVSAPFKELQRAVITAEDVCTIFQAISAQQSTPKKQQDTFSDLLLNLEWSCLEEYFFHTAKSTFHMFCWIWYFCDMFALVDTCSMSANFLVCLEKKVLTLSPIRMQSSVMQFYFLCDMNFMWASMTISYQYISPPLLCAFLGQNVSTKQMQ